jgi:hypothetical protein
MRKMIIAAATALFIGGAGVLTFAAPAFAATGPPGPTGVTVQILGGDLDISAPIGPVNLGTTAASSSTQTVTGSLGPVVVSDLRAGFLGWVATAGSTSFTGTTGPTISAATMSYTPGTAVVVGIATVTPISLAAMTTASTVQTATAVIGVNTATWNPSIGVLIPAGAVAGTYTATITHSVS